MVDATDPVLKWGIPVLIGAWQDEPDPWRDDARSRGRA